MTHGETWLVGKMEKLKQIEKHGYTETMFSNVVSLPKRLGRQKAAEYYSRKIANFFEQQLTVKDFDKTEDYFDYCEAIKIRGELLY